MEQQNRTLKYAIEHVIDQKVPGSRQPGAIRYLCSALGVSKNTFRSWCRIEADEKRDIPHNQVLLIAHLLECEVEDLVKNAPVFSHYKKVSEVIHLPTFHTGKVRRNTIQARHNLSL